MLFDEPLNNLDMKHAVGMMKLLRRAADDLGKTIVLVLHDLNFASCYSDYIVAMRDGEVVHHGTPDEIMTTRDHSRASTTWMSTSRTSRAGRSLSTTLEELRRDWCTKGIITASLLLRSEAVMKQLDPFLAGKPDAFITHRLASPLE